MRLSQAPRNEKGFVLVTILLVIAVLFPLILAFNSKVQLNLLQAENFRNSTQVLTLTRAGVQGAIGILKADDASYDSKREQWAIQLPSLSVGDATLNVRLVDEDRKIAVNTVVQANGLDPNGEVDARLRALITRLGGNPQIVDALIDWIDTNNEVRGDAGAEEEYYKGKGYHCKNGPLDSLDELLLIKGFDQDIVINKGLRNFLTVAPTDGKINVNTAEAEVLHAVLGTKTTALPEPLNESDIDDIVRYRNDHDLKGLKDLESVIKIATGQSQKVSALIKVTSAYFTVLSDCTLGKVTKNVEALLKRERNNVTVLLWREY